VLAFGARAVSTAEAVEDVTVAILSVPLNQLPAIVPLIVGLLAETIVIDTRQRQISSRIL
jgi:8-hydroxy-5-deazaflavin:NADPH oxidoreductase